MFTFTCARINGWVNNREAGDLRRYRAHYDVIVMCYELIETAMKLFPVGGPIVKYNETVLFLISLLWLSGIAVAIVGHVTIVTHSHWYIYINWTFSIDNCLRMIEKSRFIVYFHFLIGSGCFNGTLDDGTNMIAILRMK